MDPEKQKMKPILLLPSDEYNQPTLGTAYKRKGHKSSNSDLFTPYFLLKASRHRFEFCEGTSSKMVDFSALTPSFVAPQVETPAPLPKATAVSLNALRVPVSSSKRMFDEGEDVDYDSEEGQSKGDNINVGEGRGKDGEDNSDNNLIGVRL